ncbi:MULTISPECIES: VirB4 family type IV secretion/conjugal transfer ATPase [unclassified Agrobacterium]|uniref:VirB4 family type IV secretion/conjugal transfer ATPase n=1 Tax=unclassified Agrobacterium TaxID=2632611 RepID=UPI00244A5ACA|nr:MULTISPECIES: VirB4 family type IV secretion/conjugal transfer ATPase [unclassified Agrobacterium]MDH0699716.1 VirB4 family type IV secretion/conjugal transfer ATPase [Agrobacterium sp. GD03871]MDH1062573.1 VirB4 family type IV secretion/conjugal transfer ATPase [Agrobacterium sp. GD03992]MDH2228064.1 VirB4 family type IV secretion/conjugal transfer ATPase [Agrobacterium sp. GD03642]
MFNLSAAAREREPDTYVPYIGHATPGVLLLDDGSLMAMLRLDGAAFETADPLEVNARHAQRNILLRNIASEQIVLATHVVRSLADGTEYPEAECRSAFARELDTAYRDRLMANRLFRNELFLSVVLRSASSAGVAEGNIAALFARRKRGDRRRAASPTNLEAIGNVVSTLVYELGAYGARQLEMREANGIMFSELAEALRLVLTGEHMPVPLVNGHLGGAIYTDRVIIGREAIEIRGAGGSTFAAGFGLREYPATTWPGMFDAVLGAPYRCVLTQSFGFLNKQVAQNIMSRKQNQMVTAQDKAASQTAALTEAADMLASNAFVMGDHHLTLVTFADGLDTLRQTAARARRDLAESGAVIVREDLALEAAYWAQLPGNMRLRTRPGAISSRNFAAMASLHNYPAGVAHGHWGEPVTVFRSTGGTGYRFHLHAPTDTVTDLGNVFVAGPAGSGKTTLMLFLLAMAERQRAQVVFFDKDRGGDILARAVGGTYLVLPAGEPSGLAPLKALTTAPADVEFLKELVKALVLENGRDMLPEQERRLELGVRSVLALPAEARSLGELRAFLGQSDPEGPGARLDKWCKGGALGWVLDNDEDLVSLDAPFLGFDVTAVLDDPVTRGPILSYLFHRVESLLDGRRLVLAIDEFWKVLLDPGFRDLVNDKLKTIRKLNGLVILATQSPADALRSPIAHSIIEQCPTQILLPNTRADAADYRDGLKLTEPEYLAVREDLTVGGRRFLLKQGNASVACELDLTGLDDLVAVLSGRASTVRLMERLIAEVGPDPAAWLPLFRRQWRSAAA